MSSDYRADVQTLEAELARVEQAFRGLAEVAPVVYDYAYTMVEGKSPGQMADVLAETFTRTVEEARANSSDVAG